MKCWLPHPLLFVLLLAMWLLLNQPLAPGDVVLGALLALGASRAFGSLQVSPDAGRIPAAPVRRMITAAGLAWLVFIDIVHSNIGVARIIMHPGTRNQTSGFLEIPLGLRHPTGLAVLACIITATPGTTWARYDSARGILTRHILDLLDETAWIRIIKNRYERRLLEIFE
ncbi:MAG: Na+/H+ antiporter subunit E [Burkholderiales bacterium]